MPYRTTDKDVRRAAGNFSSAARLINLTILNVASMERG